MSRRLYENRILRSIAGIGGAAAFGHVLGFAISPILSRLFTESDFGKFGLFFSMSNVLVTLSMLGLQDAMLAASQPREAKSLFSAGVGLIVVTGPLTCALAYGLIRFDILGYGAMPRWSPFLIVIEVVAIAAVTIVQMFMIRKTMYRQLAVGHLVQGVMRAGSQIGAGVCGLGFFGMGISDALTRGVVAVVLLREIWGDVREAISIPIQECRQVVRKYWRFMLFRTPSTLAFNVGTSLPPMLVNMAYGVSDAGLYTFMFVTVAAPIGLVQKAIGDVFLGHFLKKFNSNPASARMFLWRNTAVLLLISIPLGFTLIVWGSDLFSFIFGAQWREAGHMAGLMIPLFMADMVIGPLGGVLNVVNRPEAKLIFDGMRIAGFCGAYIIAVAMHAPLTTMIVLFAWFGAISYGVYYGIIAYGAFRPRQTNEVDKGIMRDLEMSELRA